jgi:ABC-type transport system involved in cytochrome c biogenesis permease subunit
LHAAGLLARGLAAGRPPLGTMYEFASACALTAASTYLVVVRRRPETRAIGLYAVLPVAVAMGVAVVLLHDRAGALMPALQSGWLAVHVTAAALAVGALTIGMVASVLFLCAGDGRRIGGLSASQLDSLARAAHVLAFPIWTFAIIAGAIWAEAAWGRFWGWDPKETCAFVSWVLYAAHLHARHTAGWSRRRFAVIAVVAYASMIFNFVAVNVWFSGLHSYAGL